MYKRQALDDLDAELTPIFPTAFTQVIRTSSTSATLVDGDISQQIVEGNITVQGALRAALAALVGLLSGAGTGPSTLIFKDAGSSTKDRITASVDGAGNRLTVVLDLTD